MALMAVFHLIALSLCLGQAPHRMSYQAVIRDANNALVVNHAVGVRVSIIQSTLFGPSVYVETHSGNTNSNGLMTLEIGTGTVLNGAFNTINWAMGPYFLKTETDPTGGSAYSIVGTSELMSVPYALYAEKSGTPGPAGPQGPQGAQGPQGPAGAANINGTVGHVIRFTSGTSGGTGVLQDNGVSTAIGTTPDPLIPLSIEGTAWLPALLVNNSYGGGIDAWTFDTYSDGITGTNNATTSSGSGSGVSGQTRQSGGAGIIGRNWNSVGTGVIGAGNNQLSTYLLAGSGGAFSGDQFGCAGFSKTTTTGITRAGGYFQTNGGGSYVYVGAITSANTARKVEGNGTVNTTVKDLQNNLVVLSCPEAPENLFEDYGKGVLQGGFAHIALDPIFAKNIVVDSVHDLRVFIQLEGDCNGVFVANKNTNGFDVKELAGGVSRTSFSYHVVANRADETLPDGTVARYSSERFAPAMGPQEVKTVKLDSSQLNPSQRSKDGRRK